MPVPLAIPVVTPPGGRAGADPVAFAVPNVLVPGVVGAAAAFPTPLGSLTVLLSPPGDAGPFGTPLVAAEPAPADPAFGVAADVLVPADEPLDAPPVEAPPLADPPPPPEPPPPPPPPPLWARALKGKSKTAIRISFAGSGVHMEISLCTPTPTIEWLFLMRQQLGEPASSNCPLKERRSLTKETASASGRTKAVQGRRTGVGRPTPF